MLSKSIVYFCTMRIFFALLFFAFTTCLAQDQLLLFNANLVDVASGTISQGSVLIKDKVIVKTGPFNQLKKGVPAKSQVDCKGKYIIPGYGTCIFILKALS